MTIITASELKSGMLVRDTTKFKGVSLVKYVDLEGKDAFWSGKPHIEYLDMQDPYWGFSSRVLHMTETFEVIDLSALEFSLKMTDARKDLTQRIQHIVEALQFIETITQNKKNADEAVSKHQ